MERHRALTAPSSARNLGDTIVSILNVPAGEPEGKTLVRLSLLILPGDGTTKGGDRLCGRPITDLFPGKQ